MFFLPLSEFKHKYVNLEKVETYLLLSRCRCPVFKSILLEQNECIDQNKINLIREYLGSDECTIRYQYIIKNSSPVKGGNKYRIEIDTITTQQQEGALLWLMSPIDRTKNLYGINIYKNIHCINIEIVGEGFDVSDLNRGQIIPHQSIYLEYPIRMGYNYEWWKFIKVSLMNELEYNKTLVTRFAKLKKFGLNVNQKEFFKLKYKPLSFDKLEELLMYFNQIDEKLKNQKEFVVSCSVNFDGTFVFWDIQTPQKKIMRYGGISK